MAKKHLESGDIKPIETKHSGQISLLTFFEVEAEVDIPDNDRLDYWFPEKQKMDLAIILSRINKIEIRIFRIFFLCAFSQVLKGCSRWMMKSTKPTIDKEKVIADALKSFERQIRRMKKKNDEFWKTVGELPSTPIVDNVTSYKMRLKDDSVSLIVTSPPYVTSYEYADLTSTYRYLAIWV